MRPSRALTSCRRFLLAGLALLAGLFASACDRGGATGPEAPGPPPQRVVAANASAADYLLALLERDRIAALPADTFQYAVDPPDPSAWPAEKVFGKWTAEAVLSFDPDLVVAHSWQAGPAMELLREVGVPVLVLPEVHRFDDALAAIEQLGRALGRVEAARALARRLEARRDALRADGLSHLRLLSYTNLGTGGFSAGEGTTMDAVLALAGCQNAAAQAGLRGHAAIDLEELLAIDPDVIVCGARPGGHDSPSADLLRSEPALADLRAVRSGRIAVLPARLFTVNSQHVIDAAERLVEEVRDLPGG